jgi:hypothetical protein
VTSRCACLRSLSLRLVLFLFLWGFRVWLASLCCHVRWTLSDVAFHRYSVVLGRRARVVSFWRVGTRTSFALPSSFFCFRHCVLHSLPCRLKTSSHSPVLLVFSLPSLPPDYDSVTSMGYMGLWVLGILLPWWLDLAVRLSCLSES